MGGREMREPTLFGKFAQTVIGDGDEIVLPREAGHVDAEAELAVVIGREARRVTRERALDVVAGYVCANDVSARDLQYGDGQWFRGKNFETFCPVGPAEPVPVKELGDGSGLRVMQLVNGRVMQDGNTSDFIFDVPYLVAFASNVLTLEPGDLILTGTPSGVGWARDPKVSLQPGDVVEVRVEGIATLRNTCVADE
jgi:2-keto-4-pentenoate hydratase/2-oxohepta-3-ene-1,7-dioic acid hydratase in catechol pathway